MQSSLLMTSSRLAVERAKISTSPGVVKTCRNRNRRFEKNLRFERPIALDDRGRQISSLVTPSRRRRTVPASGRPLRCAAALLTNFPRSTLNPWLGTFLHAQLKAGDRPDLALSVAGRLQSACNTGGGSISGLGRLPTEVPTSFLPARFGVPSCCEARLLFCHVEITGCGKRPSRRSREQSR